MPQTANEVAQIRRFLRERLRRDFTTFHGHESERENIRQLIQRTAELSESNSLLLFGPRNSGKTTLINAVLTDLLSNKGFLENTLIVHLNGNLHTDDRLALLTITCQMKLENAVHGKVFGSFAENLSFLLASLKSGNKESKSVIFILDEFDLFCAHHNQTLLYNLFDVSQSAQAPICVLGITCRLDVIELLEKRVKSRFSHRQVFLFTETSFEQYLELFKKLLSIPSQEELAHLSKRVASLSRFSDCEALTFQCNHFDPSKYSFTKRFTDSWNRHISGLASNAAVKETLQSLFDYDTSEAKLKQFLFYLVVQLDHATQPQLIVEQFTRLAADLEADAKVELLVGLSVLELCLVIAIKHHSDIYDRDPFNFEIIFGRFSKFAKVSSTMQGIERAVVLKAFEHLKNLELILPVSGGACKVQKEFEMHRLALTYGQINQSVQKYQALPTEVTQWAQSSLI